MTEDNRSRAQDALNAWREYGIATSDGKGREMPIADYARAYAIQQFSNKFHNSLKERADQLSAAARREDIVVSIRLSLILHPELAYDVYYLWLGVPK